MNYINKLQKEAREQRAEIEALRAGIDRVVVYVNSTKFSCGSELDGYVNVKDITLRLREVQSGFVV